MTYENGRFHLLNYSVSACIRWENATNGKVPDDAWDAVGDDDVGANLYVGRAEHNGGMFPGTLVPDKGVAHIPWGGQNFQKKDYQVCEIASQFSLLLRHFTGISLTI